MIHAYIANKQLLNRVRSSGILGSVITRIHGKWNEPLNPFPAWVLRSFDMLFSEWSRIPIQIPIPIPIPIPIWTILMERNQ